MAEPVKAMVVDDNRMFCESLAALLERSPYIKKAWSVTTIEEASGLLKQENIAVLFADARIPGTDGIQFISKTRKEYPSLRIIGITGYAEPNTLFDLYYSGVHAILKKHSTNFKEINNCLNDVLTGRTYWPAELPRLLTQIQEVKPLQLTPRDLDILHRLCQGMPTKKIAHELGLQLSTVEDHRKRLLQKTGTKNSSELVAFVHRNGLL